MVTDLGQDCIAAGAQEGASPGQELIKNHTQSPDIDSARKRLRIAVGLFGSNEVRSAHEGADLGDGGLIGALLSHQSRQPQIKDLQSC